jgi:hypothetical protein
VRISRCELFQSEVDKVGATNYLHDRSPMQKTNISKNPISESMECDSEVAFGFFIVLVFQFRTKKGPYQKCTVFGPTGLFHNFAKPLWFAWASLGAAV